MTQSMTMTMPYLNLHGGGGKGGEFLGHALSNAREHCGAYGELRERKG